MSDRVDVIEARLSAFLEAVPEGVSIESAAIFELTMAWQRVRELETANAIGESRIRALQAVIDSSLEYASSLEAALTPFAAVGAAVAALRDVRPQSSYAPEHAALTIGSATVTFAHLIAAADVLAVRAEAVTGGESSKGGISEHGEKAK